MLHNYIERYKHSAFARNVATALTGTAAAQLIQVVGAPLLAFLYSPETFGVFSLYVATTALFSVAATLRYEIAVTLVENREDAKTLVRACILIAVGMAVLSIGLVASLAALVPGWKTTAALRAFVWLVPLSVMLLGAFQALYYFALREQRFRLITAVKIAQSFAFVVLPSLFWLFGFHANGLVWGYVLHQAVALALIALLVMPALARKSSDGAAGASAIALLKRYRNLPGLNALHAFTDSAQQALLNYLIASFYGNAMLGLYALAYRALRAPAAVVSAALSQVVFQRMSDNYNKGISNFPTFKSITGKLALLSLPLFGLVIAFAPWLFDVLMGEEWRYAGVMVQCLSPWIVVAFVSSPLSHLPNITFSQGRFLVYTLAINALAFGAFLLTWLTGATVFLTLFAFSFWWGVGCALLLWWFGSLSKRTAVSPDGGTLA